MPTYNLFRKNKQLLFTPRRADWKNSLIPSGEQNDDSYKNSDGSPADHISACMIKLQEVLRPHHLAKIYHIVDFNAISFPCQGACDETNINVNISVLLPKEIVNISCVIYSLDGNRPPSKPRPSIYKLMTKMMKYKAILDRGRKEEQLARFGGKFVYARQLGIRLLEKENFIDFNQELDSFISSARRMNCDFLGMTESQSLKLKKRPTREERRAVTHNSIFHPKSDPFKM
jgi:hypothetical protein